MRAVTRRSDAGRDDGAVLVMVGLMMTILLGVGALVIDLGALYVEKRELQNGADAAALAIAQECAGGDCGSFDDIAEDYVDLNARDRASTVSEICGSPAPLAACLTPRPESAAGATGWVKVSDVTENESGGNQVQFVLAPIMNSITGATMRASAIAAWGSPGNASTIPLIISQCEYEYFGGSIPDDDGPLDLPNLPATIYLHTSVEATPCPGSPAGGDAPGGFGWLSVVTDCTTLISAGRWVDVSTGAPPPNSCNPSDWQDKTLVIAIFDETNNDTGGNLEYHIKGFAAFHITGYAFSDDFWSLDPDLKKAKDLCPAAPGGSGVCVTGFFTQYSTQANGFGGPNLGVVAIKMVG